MASKREALHGLDRVEARRTGVVAVALAIPKLDVDCGVVEGEGGDTGLRVGI